MPSLCLTHPARYRKDVTFMTQRTIFGVCLVKNEEHFIGWALNNVVDFCDEILVMNNRSQDRTGAILDTLAAKHDHLRIIEVTDANRTHAHVEHLAGTNTWVFGVDGDEISIECDGRQFSLPLASIEKARLVPEFDN